VSRPSRLNRLVELVDQVVTELGELRVDLVAVHEIDGLDDEALTVELELHRIAETGFLESLYDRSAALELADLVEKLLAGLLRECDRSSERLDQWHRLEAIA
jgi:hypothetical protein